MKTNVEWWNKLIGSWQKEAIFQTEVNLKSVQGEWISVTEKKREREQIIIKGK